MVRAATTKPPERDEAVAERQPDVAAQLLASLGPFSQPADVAAHLKARPAEAAAIFSALQRLRGNAYTVAVAEALTQMQSTVEKHAPSMAAKIVNAGLKVPQGDATERSAELRPVPANQAHAVLSDVRAMLRDKIAATGQNPGEYFSLIAAVGTPHFYRQLAGHDADKAAQWQRMADVQKQFAEAEAGYDDTTRSYSESMRLTLHATALLHVITHDDSLYSNFVANHVTAFRENGGWVTNNRIGTVNSVKVMQATPIDMYMQAGTLAEGVGNEDSLTMMAAEIVRHARGHALDKK